MAASEELNERNIMAIKSHSEYTRGMVRELQTEVEALKHLVGTLYNTMAALQPQITALQVKIYSGGSTSNGNNVTNS